MTRPKLTPTAAVLPAALLALLPAAARADVVFTNRTLFEAAITAGGGNPITETFDNSFQELQGGVNLFNGVDYHVTPEDAGFSNNQIGSDFDAPNAYGTFNAFTGNESGPDLFFEDSLAYTFPDAPASAFGGDFAYPADADNLGLVINGQTYDLSTFLTANLTPSRNAVDSYTGFFGVIADEAFGSADAIDIPTAGRPNSRFGVTYILDDLTYSLAGAASPVPEPLAAAGLLVGLGATVLRRRRPIA